MILVTKRSLPASPTHLIRMMAGAAAAAGGRYTQDVSPVPSRQRSAGADGVDARHLNESGDYDWLKTLTLMTVKTTRTLQMTLIVLSPTASEAVVTG